jgi:hypothetical protein
MDSRNPYQNDSSLTGLIFASKGETAKLTHSTDSSQTNIGLIEMLPPPQNHEDGAGPGFTAF